MTRTRFRALFAALNDDVNELGDSTRTRQARRLLADAETVIRTLPDEDVRDQYADTPEGPPEAVTVITAGELATLHRSVEQAGEALGQAAASTAALVAERDLLAGIVAGYVELLGPDVADGLRANGRGRGVD